MKNLVKSALKSSAVAVADALGPHRINSREHKLWTIMYHRVLPKDDFRYQLEEPGMIVTPETLEMHIREIKRNFDVVSLGEWIDLFNQNLPLPKKACAITLDDGWSDNFEYAFPILQAEQVKATVFAVAEKIDTNFQFWPNIVSALLFEESEQALNDVVMFAKVSSILKNASFPSRTEYVAHYLWHLKDNFTDTEVFAALNAIQWETRLSFKMPLALMTSSELLTMRASGLIEIGSHTCGHKRLNSTLTAQELNHEIVLSKALLEQNLKTNVDLFCYPSGDFTPDAQALVKQHYKGAVTTQQGITKKSDFSPHKLQRIRVHEAITNTPRLFRARLSGWI
jgi:peptidoglycan/xylan/chitin deacetylase (PgdA/CDA1 family)